MPNYNEQLKYAIEALAQARAEEETQTQRVGKLRVDLITTPMGQKLEQAKSILATLQRQSASMDAKTRELILAQYAEDRDKHPHPAVTVKEFTSVQIDSLKTVIAWIEKNLPAQIRNALIKRSIDKAQLKKALNLTPVDGARLVKKPSPTISKDLSDYLPTPATLKPEEEHDE